MEFVKKIVNESTNITFIINEHNGKFIVNSSLAGTREFDTLREAELSCKQIELLND